jgi:hypothetical protein
MEVHGGKKRRKDLLVQEGSAHELQAKVVVVQLQQR